MNIRRGSEAFAPNFGPVSDVISTPEKINAEFAVNTTAEAAPQSEVFKKLFTEYQLLMEVIRTKNVTHEQLVPLRTAIAEFFAKTDDATSDEEVFEKVRLDIDQLRSIVYPEKVSGDLSTAAAVAEQIPEAETDEDLVDFTNESQRRAYYTETLARVDEAVKGIDTVFQSNDVYYKAVKLRNRSKLPKELLRNSVERFQRVYADLERQIQSGATTDAQLLRLNNEYEGIQLQLEQLAKIADDILFDKEPEGPVTYEFYQEYKNTILLRCDHIVALAKSTSFPLESNPQYHEIKAKIKFLPDMSGYTDSSSEAVQLIVTKRFEQLKKITPLLDALEEELNTQARERHGVETVSAPVITASPAETVSVVVPQETLVLTPKQRVFPPAEVAQESLVEAATKEVLVPEVSADGVTTEELPTVSVTEQKIESNEVTTAVEKITLPEHRLTLAEMVSRPFSEDELLTKHLYDDNVRPYVPAALMELGMAPADAERWVIKTLDPIIDKIQTEGTAPVKVAAAINLAISNKYNELTGAASVTSEVETVAVEERVSESDFASKRESLLASFDERMTALQQKLSTTSKERLVQLRDAVANFHDVDPGVAQDRLAKYASTFEKAVKTIEETDVPAIHTEDAISAVVPDFETVSQEDTADTSELVSEDIFGLTEVLEQLESNKFVTDTDRQTILTLYENYTRMKSEGRSSQQLQQMADNIKNVFAQATEESDAVEAVYQESQSEKITAKENYRAAESAYQTALRDFYIEHKGKSEVFDDVVNEAYAAYTLARKNYFSLVKDSIAARRAALSPEQQQFLSPDRIIATEARLNAVAANQLVVEAAKARLEIQKAVLAEQSLEASRLVETAKRVSGWLKRNKKAIRTISFVATVSVASLAAAPLGVAAVAGAGAIAGAGWGARLYTGAKGALFGAASMGMAAKVVTDAGISRQERVVDTKVENIKITFTENSLQDFDIALGAQLEKLRVKEARQGKVITAATIAGGVTGALVGGGAVGSVVENISEAAIEPSNIPPAVSMIETPDGSLFAPQESVPAPVTNPDEYYGVELNDPEVVTGDVGRIFSDHATPPTEGPVPGVILPEEPSTPAFASEDIAVTAEAVTPIVGENGMYTVESGDNFWDIMEGQTAAGMLPSMRMVAPEHMDDVVRMVQQAIDTDSVLRGEIGFGENAGDLRSGGALHIQRLDELATKIAIDNNFLAENDMATVPVETAEAPVETEVRVRPGDVTFSIVDSAIASKLADVPEFEQQEIRSEVHKMLSSLSPDEVRSMGIESGNIHQIVPGEKINLGAVMNFVETEVEGRWSGAEHADFDTQGTDTFAAAEADTAPTAEKMATIVTDDVFEQKLAEYEGGKVAFEKDFARYIASIQGADPKGGWFSAILAPDANKANAFAEMQNVPLKDIEQVMNMPTAEQLQVLRSHNIRLGDFNAWQDAYDAVKSSGLVKPWQPTATFGSYMTKGFIAQKINGVVT